MKQPQVIILSAVIAFLLSLWFIPAIRSQTMSGAMGVLDSSGYLTVTLGTLLNIEVPATTYRYISVGTSEDEHAVKATAGTIFSIYATNTAATVAFLKCEDDTAANTAPGTDVPEFSAAIPGAAVGGPPLNAVFPLGFAFVNAWTCWIVTTAPDAGVTEVAADVVHVFYTFK
jgi:hypothetical protein